MPSIFNLNAIIERLIADGLTLDVSAGEAYPFLEPCGAEKLDLCYVESGGSDVRFT